MPSPKSHKREEKKNSRTKSFHGRSAAPVAAPVLARPRTVPDLMAARREAAEEEVAVREVRLTKLLVNVTVQRSLGAVQVVMPPEATVGDLIAAAMRQYKKEGRRPMVEGDDAAGFSLHYSQFSLQSLDRDERLITLGSRNFFLFPRKPENDDNASSSSCSKQAEKATKIAFPWLKFLF